jgi:Family of unknown function (DUF6480)
MSDVFDRGTDPEHTPGLEGTTGVEPGATPPEAAQTSGLSEPEPRTSRRFPPTGIATIIGVILLVLLFLAVAIGLIVQMAT